MESIFLHALEVLVQVSHHLTSLVKDASIYVPLLTVLYIGYVKKQ